MTNKSKLQPIILDELLGDASKGFRKLGWTPEITLEEMIEEMIEIDKNKALEESTLIKTDSRLTVLLNLLQVNNILIINEKNNREK